jgi:uncharacterized protein
VSRPYVGPRAARISLLIVQPTPFCNIQCDYCYLPGRHLTHRLTRGTFHDLIDRVFASGLVHDQLSLVWHAGEPLVPPVSYYADLLGVLDDLGIPRTRIRQSIQTNGMLLSDKWCEFIQQEHINIGVSIDGPAFLHDRHRKDRDGRGTHERAVKGVRLLQANGIDFHVIAVITADALDHADAIFDFFQGLGVTRLGFNVEELEGDNKQSSLVRSTLTRRRFEERIRKFWERLYERQAQAGSSIRIREFVRAYQVITEGPPLPSADAAMTNNPQTAPFGIVSCDWQGNLSSFSPELLGITNAQFGNFTFGNTRDDNLLSMCQSPTFTRVATEIHEGVKQCQSTCQYFSLCGGGAPSNKYFENGSFASTETMYCRTTIQMPIDVVLGDFEEQLGVASRHQRSVKL